MKLVFDTFKTPLGKMTAVFSADALVYLDFMDCGERIEKLLYRRFPKFEKSKVTNPFGIRDCLDNYFKGASNPFKGLKLETGGTAFQKSVWRALQNIPYGRTLSYSELAQKIKKPKAVRAVGSANGRNPIAIIIPCHRVIARDGTLAGYAGGVMRKRDLLTLEGSL